MKKLLIIVYPFLVGLTMSQDSVLDVICNHKYVECGPLNAICTCDANDKSECTEAGTCMCNSVMNMAPKTYEAPQEVAEKAFTTVCELDLGNYLIFIFP